jgi:uncharacterized repeat protein (TIGR03803 family)
MVGHYKYLVFWSGVEGCPYFIPVGAPNHRHSDLLSYGTTTSGGTDNSTCGGSGGGTVFKISPAGKLTTLHKFCGSDGANPTSRLVQATDGTLCLGGNNACEGDCGTVFNSTPAGKLTTLHWFHGSDGNGRGGLFETTKRNSTGRLEQVAILSCGSGYGCGTVYGLSVASDALVEIESASCNAGEGHH